MQHNFSRRIRKLPETFKSVFQTSEHFHHHTHTHELVFALKMIKAAAYRDGGAAPTSPKLPFSFAASSRANDRRSSGITLEWVSGGAVVIFSRTVGSASVGPFRLSSESTRAHETDALLGDRPGLVNFVVTGRWRLLSGEAFWLIKVVVESPRFLLQNEKCLDTACFVNADN